MAQPKEEKIIEKKDIDVIDGKVCLTSKALYLTLDVNECTPVDWAQKGCPKISRGWWSIQDVLKWRGMIGGGGVKTDDDIKEKSLQEQKLHFEVKLKEAQTESTELKNAISRGDYIPKTEIVGELQKFFTVFKKSCQGVSNKVAIELSLQVGQTESRRIGKLVADVMNDALQQLSINGIYDIKEAEKTIKEIKAKRKS